MYRFDVVTMRSINVSLKSAPEKCQAKIFNKIIIIDYSKLYVTGNTGMFLQRNNGVTREN